MFGTVIVAEQGAGGKKSEQLTQLKELVEQVVPGEVIFLLISKMPAVFQKAP